MATTSGAGNERKPTRGILKTSRSDRTVHSNESQNKSKEAAHFDEMNILATHHPADKDYGHMKIEEPKTPYRHNHDEDETQAVDPEELSKRLTAPEPNPSRTRTVSTDEEEDDSHLTPQAREKKQKFEAARKKHYNMRNEIQRAKELLQKENAESANNDND